MNMSFFSLILLNAYYIGTATAFVIKKILWLRIVMIGAGLCMIGYAIIQKQSVVLFWVSLFTIINSIHVVRLYREQRHMSMSIEMENIYSLLFSIMTEKEFLLVWNLADIQKVTENTCLCIHNTIQDRVMLILAGTALVTQKSKEIAELSVGRFIGEMGFFTEQKASADVVTQTEMTYMSWSYRVLNRLKENYPSVYHKFHHVLSHDLTKKLKRYTAQ